MPSRDRVAELLHDEEEAARPARADEVAELAAAYASVVDASKRQASLGILAAGLSHHVLNPLAALRTNAQLIVSFARKVPGTVGEDIADMGADVATAAERILTTIGRLEGLSRDRDVEVESVELAPLAAALVGEDGAVSVEVPVGLRVQADPAGLRRVLGELLDNAREALGTSASEAPAIWIRAHAVEAQPTVLSVVDAGPGVPEDCVEHIFEPFYTSHADRFGMGLPASRLLVERMGGRLIHETRVGGGAAFSVVFPAAARGR